jgi:serine/threonine protein kinase
MLRPIFFMLRASLSAGKGDSSFGMVSPEEKLMTLGKEAFSTPAGTYMYMAPEVIRYEHYNEKCDVYRWVWSVESQLLSDSWNSLAVPH